MTLADRLRSLAASLPSDASAVTFTRADLLALVEGATDKAGSPNHERDLSVEEVAEQTGRAPSTVRGWLGSGRLRGFKLNARDWRVPPAALADYLAAQAVPSPPAGSERPEVDIAAWRRVC